MNNSVANNIAQHRAAIGISQQELAEAIIVSRKTISTIETGRFTPSVHIALSIARYFGVQVEAVFHLMD